MGIRYKIERFIEGDTKRTAWSCETMNEIIDCLNAILASEGRGGIKIVKSDGKFIFEANFSGSTSSGSTPPTPGSGSVTNYYTNCLNRYA